MFAAWNDFEKFPRFMQSIRTVQCLDDRRQRWTAEVQGNSVEWETQITVTIPNQRIAWRLTGEDSSSGAVTMHPAGGGTELTLQFAYGPTAPWALMEDNEVRASAARDLEKFKTYFETDLRPAGVSVPPK